jgi:dienelactone hydrolase
MQFRATLILILCTFLLPGFALSQAQGCDGERYRTSVFSDVEVTTAIKFGENTTIGGNLQDLYMDVYEPANDNLQARPAVVLAFGGGFVAGEREDLDGVCRALALKGYVAATIDYRLFDLLFPIDSNQMTDVVVKAVGDMKAAIRYLRQDAATDNQFRIDTNFVIVGGISAGAITAAHTAYLDIDDELPSDIVAAINNNGGIEGNSSSNYQYSSSAQGVINYSGALKFAGMIDENDPPLLSVHDDGDTVVPYGNGVVPAGPIVVLYLEGSQTMHAQAESVGVVNELFTIENSNGHVSYFLNNANQYEAEVEARTASFIADIVCGPLSSNRPELSAPFAASFYPNPVQDRLNIQFDNTPETYSLHIYDNTGKMVAEQHGLQDQQLSVELGHLQNGLYTVQVTFARSPYAPLWHKLIVNKG